MKKSLLLLRLSLLTTVLMVSKVGGVAGQTMAWANRQTPVGHTSVVHTGFAPINLRQLLTQLETTYQVRFNYKASLVNNVTVTSPAVADYDGRIADQLNVLLSPARLRCRTIDARTFVIQPQDQPRQLERDAGESTSRQVSPGVGSTESTVQNNIPPDRVLSGRVTDGSTNDGLPGVSVVVKGTQRGTTTDSDGRYRLIIPEREGAATLVFSFVGYSSKEVNLGNLSAIDVQLLPDDKSLSEVVVVGYGTQRKIETTGAISSVKAADLLQTPVANVAQGLQARVAGVHITQNSGAPGGNVSVRIRGTNSINGTSEPLYVVDGIQISNTGGITDVSPLSQINPNDIESVDVLKDATWTPTKKPATTASARMPNPAP